ncbi:Tn3 family transposase [Holosporaceae bacterium 'Namur']|nr:Tn3 family transposase [Holosporaceae bacterium 'Namur']
MDNRISAHATRLVANSIIAYNAIILNTIYEKMVAEKASPEIMEIFSRISPIAWTHIAFTGRYNFKKNDLNMNIESLVEILEKQLKKHFTKAD